MSCFENLTPIDITHDDPLMWCNVNVDEDAEYIVRSFQAQTNDVNNSNKIT